MSAEGNIEQNLNIYIVAWCPVTDLSSSVVWDIGLQTLDFWCHGFEYHRRHGCSTLVFVVCCVGSDLAAMSPTGYVYVWDRDFKRRQPRSDLGCWITRNSKCCAMSWNSSVEIVTWLRTGGRRNTLVIVQTGYGTHPSSCLIGGDPSLELKILNNISWIVSLEYEGKLKKPMCLNKHYAIKT
jgi:hypothetical protein